MLLDIVGSKGRYSAHGEYQHGIDPKLKPCPFCGEQQDLQCDNTWTPYYRVACCNCTSEGPTGSGPGSSGYFRTKKACTAAHQEAFDSAIERWNKRS